MERSGLSRLLRSPLLTRACVTAILGQYVSYVTIYGCLSVLAVQRFHASGPALGLLSVGGVLPSALTSLASQAAIERWGVRRTVACGFAVAAMATAMAPVAPSLWALDATAAGAGSGLGVILPTLMTVAVAGLPRAQRGGGMGFFQAVYALGNSAGPAVAGSVGAAHGMSWLFWSTAALSGAGSGLAFLLVPPDAPASS